MEMILIFTFCIGYLLLIGENVIHINKSATALLTGVLCWVILVFFSEMGDINAYLFHHLSEISGILFFLMSAMTIVELIDAHNGFDVITNAISTKKKVNLLWLIAIITFFLSAALDNLTTAIVMVSLLRKIINDKEDRFLFVGIVVIAANAGGAWSPIGDVTTTMLWIGGQVSAVNIMKTLFIPSLIAMLVPCIILSRKLKGEFASTIVNNAEQNIASNERKIVFYAGLVALINVPIFKTYTHLPPFMGILFSLALLWILIELLHRKKSEDKKDIFSVQRALQRIDVPSILFFLGILLAIAALEVAGVLKHLAVWMDQHIENLNIIVVAIGLLSAVVDNVPLVAASMGMYDLSTYPSDHYLWEFLAYCAGTGGSILIIGSAAGVAAMGMEKIDFIKYFKKISLLALVGYLAGAITYILIQPIFN